MCGQIDHAERQPEDIITTSTSPGEAQEERQGHPACVLFAFQALHQGAEVDFEQPLKCGTWSLPYLERLREQLFTVRVD
eukprot:8998501-Pyramimonas_sp.AAC.1